MPFFSVIIPMYNRAQFIAETLDSVLAQSFKNFEVIVVDDGSTDRGGDIVRGFGGKVKLYSHPNSGECPARNLGIKYARGEYLTFLDSDDLWFPWTLETYYEVISKHGFPSLLNCSYISFHDAMDIRRQVKTEIHDLFYRDYWSSWHDDDKCACAGATVVKCEIARSVGGYAAHKLNAGDQDFLSKIGTAPGFVRLYEPVTFAYRQHEGMSIKNHDKVLHGMLYNISEEKQGRYPGGEARRIERLKMLSAFARSASMYLLRYGQKGDAWQLYKEILGWNFRLGRVRYLLGFVVLICFRIARDAIKKLR